MADKKKVLMVVTAVKQVPGTDVRTGFYLRELTHPYFEVWTAGYDIDVASIPGGPVPVDPHSDPREANSNVHDDMISMGFLASPQHAKKLENTLRLAEADPSNYEAIFFAGGAGAILDIPFDTTVPQLVSAFWETGKVVSTVCHGGGALLNAKLSDGKYLVAGQEVTALTTDEEHNIHRGVPEFNTPLWLEDELPKRGAIFRKKPHDVPFAITSGGGRLVTGQNNSSGTVVGQQLVVALANNER